MMFLTVADASLIHSYLLPPMIAVRSVPDGPAPVPDGYEPHGDREDACCDE